MEDKNYEEEILKFWHERGIFEKSVARDAEEEFVFYDGPPFATGTPHYGHILASTIKDLVPRYQTLRGKRVSRRWGWDCHGLPVETIVEKLMGLGTKAEIEKVGVDTFNATARSKVLEYADEWKKTVERIGRWVNFDGSYKTMDNSYVESVWWALKRLHERGLIYEGRKVLLYCPRCETSVSKAEVAMDNSYRDVKEEAITVKFGIKGKKFGDNFFLSAWTTTPWTLPGNVALAVHPDLDYPIGGGVKGRDLIGLEYEHLYGGGAGKVIGADFVTKDEGTGIVHIAPMYGEDDYAVCVKNNFPMTQILDARGHFNENAPEFIRGVYFKDAEELIKKDLNARGLIEKREWNTHSYPHCWRCETALIYNAVPAWFINVQGVKGRVLELNKKTHWVPEHLREGRFAKIVESAPDWNISRNRYWASPLPFWRCSACGKFRVVGGYEDLRAAQGKRPNTYFLMRHGEADSNVGGYVNSDVGAPVHLTEIGRESVKKRAASLAEGGIDLIVSSDFIRARETAEIVANACGIPADDIVYDRRLREISVGEYNGKKTQEFLSHFKTRSEREFLRVSGGESLSDVKRRMQEAVLDLEALHEEMRILIVSHGDPLWILGGEGEYPKTGESRRLDYPVDLHRPFIDRIEFNCSCGGVMKRVQEVVDCWVESAAMPFASIHYPFENLEFFKSHFPAQFVAEYIAQTRTWFYYSFILSALLFDKLPFENLVTTGTILAEDGSKMSKSKGNYPDPWIMFEKYGVDALRFYLMSSQVMRAEDLNFSEAGVREVKNKVIDRLLNVFNFYRQNSKTGIAQIAADRTIDKWILARIGETRKNVTSALDMYEIDRACGPIADFVEDLSVWYIRRTRKSFSSETCRVILLELSKIIAPFMPFLAEKIYIATGGREESVHLDSWPADSETDSSSGGNIMEAMRETRKVVERALAARSENGIRVRQPLSALYISDKSPEIFTDLVADEVNVKSIERVSDLNADEIRLDINITQELKLEGEYRDLLRAIQDKRKEAGLMPTDEIALILPESARWIFEKFGKDLKHAVRAREIKLGPSLEVLR